jgi:xylulokinase
MFKSAQNGRVSLHPHTALGVDIGTTNTKVVVVEIGGSGAVREVRRHVVPTPDEGAGLRDAVLGAIATVTVDVAHPILAVGIASMAETGAVIDRRGNPLGGLLRWNDGDSRLADELVTSAGAAELYAATGVPDAAKTPSVHWLRLLRDGDPRIADARWCGVADLIALTLTGSWVTDHTLAARTLGYRSTPLGTAPHRTFDVDLLALGGLTPDRMPEVLEPGSPAGALTREAALATGLTAGIPVFIAGHDHAVGAWAAGTRDTGDAANSVGTAEALYRVSATPIQREAARRAGMSLARTVDGAHESLLAGNRTAGALVEWAFRTIFPNADRRTTFASAALASPGWSGEPLVLPFLGGRQSPAPDRSATIRVVDRAGAASALPTDHGAALVAILGGLVLQLAWMDATQDDVLGAPRASALRVLGGPGAANDAWWTLKQAIVPGNLSRVDAAEPVATGAALLATRAITGISPTLPSSTPTDLAPGASRRLGDTALLRDFVAAATRQKEEETT